MNRPRPVHLVLTLGVLLSMVTLALILTVGSGRGTSGDSTPRSDSRRIEVVPATMAVGPGEGSAAISPAEVAPPPIDPDGLLSSAVSELSSHPALATWLMTDDLVDRFVLAVASVAGGYSPRDQLVEIGPDTRFHVTRSETDRLVPTYTSYARYDVYAEVFASLDTAGVVEAVNRILPACERRYGELTWVRGTFRDTLIEAMDHLLATPRIDSPPEVVPGVMTYHYADSSLANLSEAQQHLLRMGPRNVASVLDRLEAIREAFARPASGMEVEVEPAAFAILSADGSQTAAGEELVPTPDDGEATATP